MRIRIVTAAAAFALTAGAALPAHAQLGAFGIAAGASIPTGDFADQSETGFHVSLLLGAQPPLLPIGFRVEGSYHQFAGKEGVTIPGLGTTDVPDLRLLNLTGNVIFQPSGILPARPYVIGGIGLYNTKFDVDNIDSDNDFGWNVGVGGKFSLTGFAAFAEVRYHRVSSGGGESTAFIPVTFGLMF
ncbi:MAG TPA: outer membrane beta-barrel protein [Gemmatimonadaceae bacterium]|nr:outer membrane beta-barrel protein [Gemmatimonadaceae bacterium]